MLGRLSCFESAATNAVIYQRSRAAIEITRSIEPFLPGPFLIARFAKRIVKEKAPRGCGIEAVDHANYPIKSVKRLHAR